jgi:DNA-directed RNA polymerase specialized sigma24 family protein
MIADQRNDGSLLKEVASSGSNQALDLLVKRHFAMVFNVCFRQLGEGYDAEDAAQAVFIVL